MTFLDELDQLIDDIKPMAKFLVAPVLLVIVLALNVTLHHDAYVPPAVPVHLAPAFTPEPTVAVASTTSTTIAERGVFDRLADCESGEWDRFHVPIVGTARWDDQRGGYEGGVHFTYKTWTENRPATFPAHAYDATRAEQLVVAESVLHVQGAHAWPTCSGKVGLRG